MKITVSFSNLLRTALTLLLCVVVGPLFGAMPLVAAASLDQISRQETSGVLAVLNVFSASTFGAYVFGVPTGFWQSLVIGAFLSLFGMLTRNIGTTAFALTALGGLAVGAYIFWRGLMAQNHPNAAGAMFLNPAIFVACHFFLAASSWLMARSIWRTQEQALA